MLEKAKEGYFVRDPERNMVYCPMGEELRQKAIKKSGAVRYANKNACKHCKYRNRCYQGKSEWKEIDFTKDTLEKPCKTWNQCKECKNTDVVEKRKNQKDLSKAAVKQKSRYETVKLVRFTLKPDREKMNQRMCLSEHPFGTIKRSTGATYFLLRGIKKVTGEFALFCLGYNIERVKNLLGFEKMMEIMAMA